MHLTYFVKYREKDQFQRILSYFNRNVTATAHIETENKFLLA